MTPHTDAHRQELEALLPRVAAWASVQDDIRAVLLVGSWARGNPRPDSDVDLVLLTDDVRRYLDGERLLNLLQGGKVVRERNWGAIEERRIRLPSRLEIDVGIGEPSWAATDAVDPGTRRVVLDGARIIYDPAGLAGRLLAACREAG